MHANLGNVNHCAVPILSRAAANLSWYDIILLLSHEGCNNFAIWQDRTHTKKFKDWPADVTTISASVVCNLADYAKHVYDVDCGV